MVEKMFDISRMTVGAIEEAAEILKAYAQYGVPDDFWDDGVQIAYNENSGMVFLTNEDSQVAVLEDGKLVSWYFTPYEGLEGTFADLVDMFNEGDFEYAEDMEYLRDIAEAMYDTTLVERIDEVLKKIEEEENGKDA